METFDIPVNNMMSAFEVHLNDGNGENNRILFSGPFGCGKTFFLKKFFEQNKQRYRAFHLFPVNYQVSSNRDIFKLLKYDILLKLIEHGLINDKEDVSQLQSMKRFIGGNGKDVVLDLLESLPQIGGFISGARKLKEFVVKYKEEQVANSEEKYVESIIDQLPQEEGSIYELDNLTGFISQKLKENNNFQNLLIIDDLDRIDPEQIFRILNLLTAHIDNQSYSSIEQKNKFGFDKIIIVCDVENIRHIFHEKYGQNVNFSGYIDKFYSKSIFEYNIRSEIKGSIRDIIKPLIEKNERERRAVELMYRICEPLLEKFVMEGVLQIRELEKLFLNPSEKLDGFSRVFQEYQVHEKSFDYFFINGFFLHVFNKENLKLANALDICSERPSGHLSLDGGPFSMGFLFGHFLPFIGYSSLATLMNEGSSFQSGGKVFHFKIKMNDQAFVRDTFSTIFFDKETGNEIPYPDIKIKEQTIFKAWREALKVSHNV